MKLLAASTVSKSSSLVRLCWKQGKQDIAWDSKNFKENMDDMRKFPYSFTQFPVPKTLRLILEQELAMSK